ncbi:MAG: protein kinase [Pseudonocardiaceae bacterium]|nr:protein kinase [Pseudonocardiaceae bacterium]
MDNVAVPTSESIPGPNTGDLPPRLVVGRYRLDAVLGRGAMGTVWSGYDEVLGRSVAVKEVLVPPGIPEAEADAVRARTLREARAIAMLSHPNVVTLYDVARQDGEPIVVMEYVASRSLAEVMREGPLTPGQAATVGISVAAALAAAHAAGITHRDVKPGNVLVGHDGGVKLTDFGIARNPADVTLTGTGLMLGSPAYMAPEVASGRPVSPAADLWGLGATLFAATQGHPPYDEYGDPVDTVAAVVHGDVPSPGGSGVIPDVISALMVKEPNGRMPLHEVHRLLRPLARDPARAPFPAAASAPPVRPSPPPPAATLNPEPRHRTARHPTTEPKSSPAPLAPAPGPLPWQTAGRPRVSHARVRPRPIGAVVLLYVLAAVLLVGTAVAGFVATRTTAGAPILPASPSVTAIAPSTPTQDPPPVLERRRITIDTPDESQAAFTVVIPPDWSQFGERRTIADEPTTVVRFVSPDGSEAIAVESVPGYDGERRSFLNAYLATISESVTELFEVGQERIDSQLEVTYRTVEGSEGDTEQLRTSFLRLQEVDSQLWTLQVTVPTQREEAGRTELFDRVVPSFTVL